MTAAPPAERPLRGLRRRAEFLRAARGRRAGRGAFALQAAPNVSGDVGVGLTVTKKTGNAPERNRIKRRLRAVVSASARDFAGGNDYVLIGRRAALHEPFANLVEDLRRALARIEDTRTPSKPHPGRRPGRSSERLRP